MQYYFHFINNFRATSFNKLHKIALIEIFEELSESLLILLQFQINSEVINNNVQYRNIVLVEDNNEFRSQIQLSSLLNLGNINVYSENLIKTLLNLTYGYALENLNKKTFRFPGLDIGDSSNGIAFQVTSTKKSNKINKTLETCLKYKHYKSFKSINLFILTGKQTSYAIRVKTEPHFTFSSRKNVMDLTDLLQEIQHLDLPRMKKVHDYIEAEMHAMKNRGITPKEYSFIAVEDLNDSYRSLIDPILKDKGLNDNSVLGVLMCGPSPEQIDKNENDTPWTVFVNDMWLKWLLKGQASGFKVAQDISNENIYGQIPCWPDNYLEFLTAIVKTKTTFEWKRHENGYLGLSQKLVN